MIGYPYFRSDLPLEATALRLPGVNGDWDPASDRLLIPTVVTGEPLKLEARLIADVPSVYTLPLLPKRHRLTLFAVAALSCDPMGQRAGKMVDSREAQIPLRDVAGRHRTRQPTHCG